MDSLRKWLNKPKADDKSLLARFYHADRALTAVASELDSFDGRAEPERCSRLVGRLRQGQDRVLAITNQIMDELLGDDRAPRAFRAKFPEEVLQESLAGQLWFGAECLAAGSSIMNREIESATMRPLAKAVTKSLDNVRNLVREQCLRNNTPNSLTLKLDINDAATEQLYESLKIFDRLFAEFELLYVSAMVQVKSKHEHEVQELICVLFSETLQRALKIGLLEQEQVDSYDPALMFSIPRLAIIAGLIIHNKGPLNMDQTADSMSEMFRPFRKLLIKMRDLLRTLNKNELYQLEKLLCTNEEINLRKQFVCDDENVDEDVVILTTNVNNNNNDDSVVSDMYNCSNSLKDIVNNSLYGSSISINSHTIYEGNSENVNDWQVGGDIEEDDNELDENLLTVDCASGYLIPNTNFGNLLQTNEAPLTDSFISSDDEVIVGKAVTNSTNDNVICDNNNKDSGIETGNTSLDHTPDSETQTIVRSEENRSNVLTGKYCENWEALAKQSSCSKNKVSESSDEDGDGDSESTLCDNFNSSNPTTSHHKSVYMSRASLNHQKSSKSNKKAGQSNSNYKKNSKVTKDSSSSCDTSPSQSICGDSQEVAMAIRAAGRMKFKTTENLLHRLFVCIAGVADQLQTNFAADLRQILKSVFLINSTPLPEELSIEGKRKDIDLFEFRASENDVIRENSAGSNQSIYSAEEVNPELESVFPTETIHRGERSTSPGSHGSLENNNVTVSVSVSVVTSNSRTIQERSVSLGDATILVDDHNIDTNIRNTTTRRHSSTNVKEYSRSRSNGGSPINNNNNNIHTNNNSNHDCVLTGNHSASRRITETPPRWIPDDEASRCMACASTFTPFRRRHHCRNCGGVFCGVCSNSSAPLPKYGLTKAVRVCRDCYTREVGA